MAIKVSTTQELIIKNCSRGGKPYFTFFVIKFEKLQYSLPALLIANIVTASVTNRPTHLQIALGINVRENSQIETMHDFGVTCSYSEVLRFKASAATAAAQDVHSNLRVITYAKHGLIQAVTDNVDANISSQNGLRSPVSILHTSIAGRYRPVRVADGPITARCRFMKNASWVYTCPCIVTDTG